MWQVRALSISKEKDVDTSTNARSKMSRGQCIRDAYLCGRLLAQARPHAVREGVNLDLDEYLGPRRLEELAQALSEGDRTITAALLRGWGIR